MPPVFQLADWVHSIYPALISLILGAGLIAGTFVSPHIPISLGIFFFAVGLVAVLFHDPDRIHNRKP